VKVNGYTEVRTTKGLVISDIERFFFDASVPVTGTGTGNWLSQREVDAFLGGNVKVTRLHNGRFSFRQIGVKGGRTVHVNSAFLVITGKDSKVEFAGNLTDFCQTYGV